MAVKNELYAAESALATAHDAVIAAKTALSTAEASYNRLLGRELDEPVTLDPIPEPLISETLPELTDDAVRSSTELASLSEQVKAADAAAGAARARNLPQAALVAGYGKQNGHYLTENGVPGGLPVWWSPGPYLMAASGHRALRPAKRPRERSPMPGLRRSQS